MYRTKTCGELRLTDAGKDVGLSLIYATVMALHNLYLMRLKMLVFVMKPTNWVANTALALKVL